MLPPYQNLLIPDREHFLVTRDRDCNIVTLISPDGMNRLTKETVISLKEEVRELTSNPVPKPLIIRGERNFSAGADLNEIAKLTGREACEFSAMGQALMHAIAGYPATVIAAIEGHCMGGGLDLALACHRRIAAPTAVFGHRGAALGLITGWGGTQRLPRLIGKGKALELFVIGEKLTAQRALDIRMIDTIATDPLVEALRQAQNASTHRLTPPLVY